MSAEGRSGALNVAGTRGMRGWRTVAKRAPFVACRPIATALEARPAAPESTPIWFSALAATRCNATAPGEGRSVRFEYVAGRAIYKNCSADPESIDPLGVTLLGGQTLAVYWVPGETAYTLEVYPEPASMRLSWSRS